MSKFKSNPLWPVVAAIILLVFGTVSGVNIEKWEQLNRGQLLELDREVSSYYNDSYDKINDKKISYNDQLFRSIRAIRHTNVLNLFDFMYTDARIMQDSAGQKVGLEHCLSQLEILDKFAQQAADSRTHHLVPLSAIDLLESSARPESGVLNGNFMWLGSYTSCHHARVSYKHIEQHLGPLPASFNASHGSNGGDIVGRYCVAHLRAKSWTKDDPYFGNRITLKAGLCVPEVCHTSAYVDSQEVRDRIESLTKANMVFPFKGDEYEVSYLYCVPDEDSPHRRLNLGAKLFIVFVGVWSLLLIYSNVKYQRRLRATKKLNKSIDITMIVEQNSAPTKPDAQVGGRGKQAKQQENKATDQQTAGSMQNLELPSNGGGDGGSLTSNEATPAQSDNEEDSEFGQAIKQVLAGTRPKAQRRVGDDRKTEIVGPFDFVKAFAVKANIDFLFRRADFVNSQNTQQSSTTISQAVRRVSSGPQQHQHQQHQSAPVGMSPTTRRLSKSNAAMIKALEKEQQDGEQTCSETLAKLDAAEQSGGTGGGGGSAATHKTAPPSTKRVNIDILDGIKVFATAYIVFGHTLMFFFGCVADIRFGNEHMFDFTMIATINALQVVGLFYIITGILISYLAFSRQKVRQLLQPSFWVIVIIGRYLRLLPSYLLVFWFAKHMAQYTGSGPFWIDFRTDDQQPRGYCSHESWLTMLTMSAADVKIPYDCVPQAWYLSNDFRTLLIIPVYVIVLALNTTAGYAAIFSTLIYSFVKMTHILRDADIDYKILLKWQPHVYNILTDRLHDVYTNLSIRLSTYLLGIVVGHFLYLYEQGRIKRIPRWFKRYGLKLALLVGSMTFMGAPLLANSSINQYLPSPEQLDSNTVVMMIPFFKVMMELCICVILLALTTGGGFKWLTELLSSLPARVLSNISYGVFLVHIEVMYQTPLYKYDSNWFYLFLYSTFFIILSNVIAFFMHVLYEMPINNVLRYVFKKIFYSIVK